MTPQRFADMSEPEFDALVDSAIERMAHSSGELPADTFIDLLFERRAVQTTETLTLHINVVGDQVRIVPEGESATVLVRGNEVLVDGHRLVLQLAPRPAS